MLRLLSLFFRGRLRGGMFGFQQHPKGLRTLFFTEMWERFSYYGMRGLLMLFLVSAVQKGGFGLDDKTAAAIYGLYTAAVYLAALPGGWIADRLLGARKAVFVGGLFIVAGQFTLALPSMRTFFLGLLFIVIGTGLLKPNISVMVGQLYPEGGVKQDAGFTIFYMGINVGSAIGPLIAGYLGENVNWHLGFIASGVGMILGLVQFKLTGHYLGDVGLRMAKKQGDATTRSERKSWIILWSAVGVLALIVGLEMCGVLCLNAWVMAEWATYVIVGISVLFFVNAFFFAKLNGTEKKRVGVILLLFIASAMFFSGFEQAGSSLNIFAERFTSRYITFSDVVLPVPASWFQSLNPVFIIIFAPLVANLWLILAKRNCNPPMIIKFAMGLILLGLGFVVVAAGARLVSDETRVLPIWLIATYFIHTMGELCLSPVGLSTVSKLSPKRLVGQMMGVWFLASSLGNLIAGLVAGKMEASETLSQGMQMSHQFMHIFWFALGVAGLLLIVSKPVRRVTRDIE